MPANGSLSQAATVEFKLTIFYPKRVVKLNYPLFTPVALNILNSDRVQMRPETFSMEMQPHVLFFSQIYTPFYGAFLFSLDLIRTSAEPLQARTRQCGSSAQMKLR